MAIPWSSTHREFISKNRYGAELRRHHPDVDQRWLERFHVEAADNIYCISGFVDEDGMAALRAATKVLQRPRKLGVGVCFEGTPVHQELASRLLDLFKRVGYHGVFEAEFIQTGGAS